MRAILIAFLIITLLIVIAVSSESFHSARNRLIYPLSEYEYTGTPCSNKPAMHTHLHGTQIAVHVDDRYQRMIYTGELKNRVGDVHGVDYQPACGHNRYHGVCEKGGIDTLYSSYPNGKLWE